MPCPHCGIDTVLYVPTAGSVLEPQPQSPKVKLKPSLNVDWGGIIVGILALVFGVLGGVVNHLPDENGHPGSFLKGFFVGILLYVIFLFLLFVYFLPAIIAAMKKKRNMVAIILLNLFLGWTFIGWVVSLVWAAIED